jgi:hypothetical protein
VIKQKSKATFHWNSISIAKEIEKREIAHSAIKIFQNMGLM